MCRFIFIVCFPEQLRNLLFAFRNNLVICCLLSGTTWKFIVSFLEQLGNLLFAFQNNSVIYCLLSGTTR